MSNFAVEFVELVPSELRHGVLYVSMDYATVVHACACGCGNKVVTPLTPTDWVLMFDGEGVSLEPSVGNWSFPCRSHYWIQRSRVRWARRWSDAEIKRGRAAALRSKRQHFDGGGLADPPRDSAPESRKGGGRWSRLWSRLSKKRSGR